MKGYHKLAWLLVLVGALNWGLIGLLGINLVYQVFGSIPMLERVVYILIGVAAAWLVYTRKNRLRGQGLL